MGTSSWERYVEAETALLDAISQARGATKDLHRAVKDQRDAIAELIAAEVSAAVERIDADARQQLAARVDAVVTDLADTLRSRLDLR